MMQRTVFSTLAVGLAAVLAGCGTNAPAPSAAAEAAPAAATATATSEAAAKGVAPEHAELIARSDAYWQARRTADVAGAYALTTPGYRAVHTLEQFAVDYGAIPNLTGGEVSSVQCDEQRCELTRSFVTSSPFMSGTRIPISISETWVKQEGQWWRFVQ